MTFHEDNALDPVFYRARYPDLKGLRGRQVRAHYERHGRDEKRWPNAGAMLRDMEAREGALPRDFDAATYLDLNPDLKPVLPQPWQVPAHYISDGRREGRRYIAVHDPKSRDEPPLVARSVADALRRRLIHAFGEDQVSDALVFKTRKAAVAAIKSATIASSLMDPVLIARQLLITPDEALDFSNLRVQLKALFDIAFVPLCLGEVLGEQEVLRRVRAAAIELQVGPEADDLLPVTVFMLAALAASSDLPVELPTIASLPAFLARFFVVHVPRRRLERFVTPAQRSRLRAPYKGGAPLAAWMLDSVLRPDPSEPRLSSAERTARFWDEEVWRTSLDYVLSSEQLEAAQLRVEEKNGERQLTGPSFLLSAIGSEGGASTWVEREAVDQWLTKFVYEGQELEGLPQLLVGPSVVAHVGNGAGQRAPERRSSPGEPRRRISLGELVGFALNGADRYVIGEGWHGPEPGHRWTAACSAMLAMNLDEADLGPLDLFLSLFPGPNVGTTITLLWNGVPVATQRPLLNRPVTIHCHLGAGHRTGLRANILTLAVSNTVTVANESRRFGVALRDLMLVRR